MNPKISVVVPIYNAEAFLERCVDSLLTQSLSDIEVILVNDGSTDSTRQIIDAYALGDPRVVALHTENRGPADARHTGVQHATGTYITFQDSDDYRPADSLERLYRRALETGADIVCGNYWISRYAGSSEFVCADRPPITGTDSLHAIQGWIGGALKGGLWTALFKRELYTEHIRDFLHVRHGEDGVILIQLLHHAQKVVRLDEPVYYYELRTGSLCHYEQTWSRELIRTYAEVTRWMICYMTRIPGHEVYADELAYYALYRLSLLQIKCDGRDVDFYDLESRIYTDYYDNKLARRRLRKEWPKQWIFLTSERRVWQRLVKKGLWGSEFMRKTLKATRKTFQKIRK